MTTHVTNLTCVLGLLRNACSSSLAVHVEDCETDCEAWRALRALIATTSAANRHELEVTFTGMSKKQSEAITDYVGRVLGIRKLLVLADSDSAPTDIAVKQVILKGLPPSFNPLKIPYLYGPEAASLAGMTVADIMGFLRVYEADLARESRPRPSRAGTAATKHCTHCNRDGHEVKQCFKKRRDERKRTSAPERAMHATSDSVEVDPSVWIVHSGASRHFSGCRDLFYDSDFLECSETVTFADERVSKITGKGSVRVRFFGVDTVLKDVYYCADLGDNLFSVSAAVKHGVMISFMKEKCRFRFSDLDFHDVPFTTSQLCVLTDSKCRAPVRMRAAAIKDAAEHTKDAQQVTKENDCAEGHDQVPASTVATSFATLWHRRYGHLGFDNLHRLVQSDYVLGMDSIPSKIKPSFCEVCVPVSYTHLTLPTKA